MRFPRNILIFAIFFLKGHLLAADLSGEDTEFFEKHIRPLLAANCYECHSAEEGTIRGGLALDSRDGVLLGGESGAAILPGDPENSRLVEAIRYHNRDLQMPPKSPLPETEVQRLVEWIRRGAPDPRTETIARTEPSGMTTEQGRQFWAYRHVEKMEPPEIKDVPHPIDAFVRESLQEVDLKPAPPADRLTLIRRATFDLTGLPPTPEEIDAYLQDDAPDAFEKVMERLLASPQYGVRWARHWLDVARYADSNGLDENLAFGHAWRYRDYVVDAFNAGKPFDQFLIEQLAGDLVAEPTPETLTATGFLNLGAKVLAEPDRQKLDMDIIDEQMDTTGKAFMALTIGCARCHDHKFDPFSAADYYSMAAIFRSTKSLGETKTGVIKHWYEHSFATEEELKANEAINAEIAEKKKVVRAIKSDETTRLRTEAEEKAVDYLVASLEITPETPLTAVERVADRHGLHPRILHHCRLHLVYHREDPVFEPWHEFAAAGDAKGLRDYYSSRFERAMTALAKAKAEDAKVKTLSDPLLEPWRAALQDKSGFLAVPAKPEHAFDPEVLAEYDKASEELRLLESAAPDPPAAMGVTDGEIVQYLPIHIRGEYDNPGELQPRAFPAVMRPEGPPADFPASQSGRLEFAQWLADEEHPLTARVFVNRVWGWHFGKALVPSTENFGVLGDRPSHPELLDWLAATFMENGWELRDLHRLIMTSEAYKMASQHPQESIAYAADPENRLLWKFPLQRLGVEQVRDAILAVSGELDTSLGGKTIPLRNRQFFFNHTSEDHTGYESPRRALYLPIVRNNLYDLFQQFDYPDPTMPTGSRNATVVAPQTLFLMNSEFALGAAESMARRVLENVDLSSESERVDRAWLLAYGRMSTASENQAAQAYLAAEIGSPSFTGAATVDEEADARARLEAWTRFCQSLMASNEFLYLR